MDYRKLDPALVTALRDVGDLDERSLSVFVRLSVPPGPREAGVLTDLGLTGVSTERSTYTATLSARAVTRLAEEPWVRSVALAQRLRPVNQASSR